MIPVKPEDERPARPDGTCFYCDQPIGASHNDDCVILNKTVRARMTVDFLVDVPAFWKKQDMEFHWNEGSWCAGNLPVEFNLPDPENDCPCAYVTLEHVEDVVTAPHRGGNPTWTITKSPRWL